MKNTSSIFAERFKNRRLELGYNQQQLADRLGINRTTITNYEKGNILPTAEKLAIVANLLGVSSDYLLGNSDFINEKNAVYNWDKFKNGDYVIHDLNVIINDLKQQIALDKELNLGGKLISDENKKLINNQLENIIKLLSL